MTNDKTPTSDAAREMPFTYAYRYNNVFGDGTVIRFDTGPWNGQEPIETIPLYTRAVTAQTPTSDAAREMPELLPCPFCGGEAKPCKRTGYDCPDGFWIKCTSKGCSAEESEFTTKAKAFLAWNTRAVTAQTPCGDDSTQTEKELAMLVRRLCYRLNNKLGAGAITEQSLDYLKRKNLNGSVLRDEE